MSMISGTPTEYAEGWRLEAQHRLLRFFSVNGVVVPCIMESILMLWALHNQLSASQIAILSSFFFFTMPMMLLGKKISAKWGLVRSWSFCWIIRYLFVLAMLPSPWLMRTPLRPWIPFWILFCSFALFAFRSMGMVNTVPLTGEVTTREDQGSFQAKITLRSILTHLTTLSLIILLVHWRDSVGMYQLILGFGCVVGIISARMLLRVPEPPGSRPSSQVNFRQSFRLVWTTLRFRRLAIAWCLFQSATMLIIPIAVLTLKQGYGISDNLALSFTLLELCGGILASFALSIIADHTGPRPVLILGMILFWITSIFWSLAPTTFVPLAVGTAFLIGGLARTTQHMALNHYLLASTKTHQRMDIVLLIQVMAGALSGAVGIFVAGGLLRWLPTYTGAGLPLFRTYYRVIAILMPLALVAVLRLPRIHDWTVRNVIGLVFSSRDIRALMTLNRLRKDSSDDEDEAGLEQLTTLASVHSEPVLRDFLRNGRLPQRSHAIRALSRIPFDDETAQALIHEVREGAFTNGWRAAELLGKRKILAAIPILRQGLNSDDPFLKGKCMTALARMNDGESFDAIRRLFQQEINPRIVIHGAMALALIRDAVDYPLLLEKAVESPWPQPVLDELLLSAAILNGQGADVHRCLRMLRRIEARGEEPSDAAEFPPVHELPQRSPLRAFLLRHPVSACPRRMHHVLRILARKP